jgi:hypothetical protein
VGRKGLKISFPKFDGKEDYNTWEEAVKEYLVAYKHYSQVEQIRWIRANMSGIAR